jgi:hypothetical protein
VPGFPWPCALSFFLLFTTNDLSDRSRRPTTETTTAATEAAAPTTETTTAATEAATAATQTTATEAATAATQTTATEAATAATQTTATEAATAAALAAEAAAQTTATETTTLATLLIIRLRQAQHRASQSLSDFRANIGQVDLSGTFREPSGVAVSRAGGTSPPPAVGSTARRGRTM